LDPGPGTLALLCAAALAAGFVDAVAGGGGLLTVPALLAAGLPPHLVLGTNKGQSVWGTLAATIRYARAGRIEGRRALLVHLPLGLAGSFLGALLVLRVSPAVLRPLVLVLLPAAAAVVLLRPAPRDGTDAPPGRGAGILAAALAFAIAAYDGFFGPGTGTFLILAFTGLLGWSATRASAEAKVVNLASNAAALSLFALEGSVAWSVALPMAAAGVAGGLLGAHATLRGGDRLVRGAVALVVAALCAKIGFDLLGG
jgi:uncharacterized membrane protein YfcA